MTFPHCPNPQCPRFKDQNTQNWYRKHGSHPTITFGRVLRFRCKTCGRTFSAQSFSIDYYAKRKVDYGEILEQLISASGILDMVRRMNFRAETITNRIERLVRCCLAIQSDILELLPLKENLAGDGFETFSYSQYYPNHVNLIAGSQSEFVYAMGFSNLRRKGCMTEKQKIKRDLLEKEGKAARDAVDKSFIALGKDLTQRFISKGVTGRIFFTDEHKAYLRAFKQVEGFSSVFDHRTTPSRAFRTVLNPLFPVNYLDRQIRKDNSDHCRETVQFARCPSAMMSRLGVYQFYHNCVIPRRVREARRKNYETHAERAGISREDLTTIIRRRWGTRPFLGKVNLGSEERNTWLLKWRNPGREMGRYVPAYVAA